MLAQVLRGKEALLQKILQESENEASFLLKLKHILEHSVERGGGGLPRPPRPPAHYSQALADLEAIGWQRVTEVSPDFSRVSIRTLDKKKREHIFTVHISQEGPPTIDCVLPITFKPSWSEKTTLCEVVARFEEQLCAHQRFWDVMDELDRETWVLEPEQPSRQCNFRRIVLGSNMSLYLSIDPLRPSGLPEFKFLGPEHVVGPIRARVLARVAHWDPGVEVPVKRNLENLMDLKLPGPEASQQEGFCGECGVCYAYQLEGVVPDVVCNNLRCNQPFHFACLLEWLQTVPTTRQSFGVLFGECPYCSEQLSLKLQR
jgi:E3 ubiquitin-protein ligase FANCL